MTRSTTKKKKAIALLSSIPQDLASKVTEIFFEKDFDPQIQLKKKCKRMEKSSARIDQDRVKKNETFHVSSMFDSVEYQLNCGVQDNIFKLVFLVVPFTLSVSSSNSFQERTFFTCTWFDDSLRRSLKTLGLK